MCLCTSEAVGSVFKLQLEDVVGGAVRVQHSRANLTTANETVFSTEDYDWPIDQLHQELLRLPWRQNKETDQKRID